MVINCNISGNSAITGGGIYCEYPGNLTISNCTITGNSSSDKGGGLSGPSTITNSIIWGNSPDQIYPPDTEIFTVLYSDIQEAWPGPGNINVDPCFSDPCISDYHLLPESPCINSGDPNYVPEPNETDLDGNPRVIGDRIDMGAYEFPYKPTYLFFAVGYHGQFTHIDPSIGEVPPTRNDLPDSLQALATSPNGICYTISYSSGLFVIDPFTGDTQYLLRPKTQHPVRGMAFSPSGQLYVYVHLYLGLGYLGIVDVANGSYKQIGRIFGDNTQADGLDFSPDGTLYGTVGGKLYTIDLDDAEMHLVGNGEQFLQSSFSLAFTPEGLLYATGYDFGSSYPDYKYAFVQVNPLTGARIGEPIVLSGADRGLALVPESANTAPVSIAGPNQTVYAWIDGLADVTLDGSASYDDDNDVLDYYWLWTIDNNDYEANGISPTIRLPVGEHQIELIVDDGWVLSEPDYCTINVIEPLQTKMFCYPRVLNTRSRGRFIMAFMTMPEDIAPDDINDAEPLLLLPGNIEATRQFVWQSRSWRRRRTYIMAVFDRADCMENLSPGMNEVNVVGQLNTGRFFYGTDNLRVVPRRPWHRQYGPRGPIRKSVKIHNFHMFDTNKPKTSSV
jgi:hypothetical protein